MTKGVWIYLLILVLLATTVDCFILKTNYIIPEGNKSYSLDGTRDWMVSASTSEVDIITASKGYYRIRSGDTIIEGEYVTGKYFQKTTRLPVGKWIVEANDTPISITIPSQPLVVIVSKPILGTYIGLIFLTFIIGAYLFFVGTTLARK